MNQRLIFILILLFVIIVPFQGNCAKDIYFDSEAVISQTCVADDITSLNLLLHSTYEHISIHLDFVGDDNLNSTLQIEYRLKGTINFLSGAGAMRAHPTMIVDGNALNKNFHAGSVLFLNPNAEYELKLTLSDIDGGSTIINASIFTKKFPTASILGNVLYVAPGAGGGSGSQVDPFLGIQAAVNVAQAGDLILVSAGSYSPFTIDKDGNTDQPITIKSETLHEAIIDGGGINSGIVTIGNFIDSTQHIIIDGFEITNGLWGIDAQNTQYVTLQNNRINNVDFGIVNRRENGWEHDQWIFNNWIVGNTDWPDSGIPGERGVDIRGNSNVVSFNTITDFGDGISTDGAPYDVSFSLDIYNNNIMRIVDDLIEVDGVISNTRIYNNQCYNGRAGVSAAPILGGPVYIFRNVFYNLEFSGVKMNRGAAGLYIVNNTIVSDQNGLSSPAGWQNTFLKNNAIVSSRYCFEEYGLVSGSIDDWDYNGYKSTRLGTAAQPWFKWDNIKYDDLVDLSGSTSIESNGLAVDFSDFINVFIPAPFTTEVPPSSTNVSPDPNSNLVNAGLSLANLDLPYVSDGNTDIGAIEFGTAAPLYGHDFNAICSYSDLTTMIWTGAESDAWFSPNNWMPCGVPNELSNVVIESGVVNYPVINSVVNIKSLIFNNGSSISLLGEDVLMEVKN